MAGAGGVTDLGWCLTAKEPDMVYSYRWVTSFGRGTSWNSELDGFQNIIGVVNSFCEQLGKATFSTGLNPSGQTHHGV